MGMGEGARLAGKPDDICSRTPKKPTGCRQQSHQATIAVVAIFASSAFVPGQTDTTAHKGGLSRLADVEDAAMWCPPCLIEPSSEAGELRLVIPAMRAQTVGACEGEGAIVAPGPGRLVPSSMAAHPQDWVSIAHGTAGKLDWHSQGITYRQADKATDDPLARAWIRHGSFPSWPAR